MSSNSENTSNRVYIACKDYGWLSAKIISNDPVSKKALVEVKDYEDDISIPACEVSFVANPTQAQVRRGNRTVPTKQLEINLKEYSDGVLPLQNVDEDGKLIEVPDMVDLSFLHEVSYRANTKSIFTLNRDTACSSICNLLAQLFITTIFFDV